MKITRDELDALLRLVDATRPEEIDCDEFLARVSAYVEHLRRGRGEGEAPLESFADVRNHLEVCPECLEELEALLRHDPDADAASRAP